jgi:hypothetical protein
MCMYCSPDHRDCTIGLGPISGVSGVVAELMRHYGYEPEAHPDVARDLEQAVGEELLDVGREILAGHGLEVA